MLGLKGRNTLLVCQVRSDQLLGAFKDCLVAHPVNQREQVEAFDLWPPVHLRTDGVRDGSDEHGLGVVRANTIPELIK